MPQVIDAFSSSPAGSVPRIPATAKSANSTAVKAVYCSGRTRTGTSSA